MHLLLLFLLPLVAAQSASSCGPIFGDLIRFCGPLTTSSPKRCCPVIRRFNDALCWCQPVALSLATQLAGNQYAFALRYKQCGVEEPHIPAFWSRDGPPTKDSCPPEHTSHRAVDESEGCNNPAALRRSRENILYELDHLELTETSSSATADFRAKIRKYFTDWPLVASIGLSSNFSVEHAIHLLLARQPLLGAGNGWVLQFSRSSMTKVFWRESTVSYERSFSSTNAATQTRYMFVGFEPCSNKILDAYAVEEGVINYFATQFYYPPDIPNAVTMYDRTPEEVCSRIATGCGALSPYASDRECQEFVAELKREKQVMCAKLGEEESSVVGLAGDTVACRYSYALAAEADPERYCPFVGKAAMGLCVDSACGAEYDNVFAYQNPRFGGSNSFSCNKLTGECVENWAP